MYIFLRDKPQMRLGQAIAPVQELTQLDVMSPQIDVFAQRALVRMFKADLESNLTARSLIFAVKRKVLAGIYKEDQQVPVRRAQRMGKAWWQLIPKNADAICLNEPTDLKPIILFRDKIRSTPSRLDPALKQAWMSCPVAQLTPPPYKPKAFPQSPKHKPLPDYPPSADRPRCDDRELQSRFEECDKRFNDCRQIADDWRFKEMLECGADRECRNNAIAGFKMRQAQCASGLIACQERAKC